MRLNKETAFETGTTGANFIGAIKAAFERRKFSKDQKKVGETLITAAFQVKLKTANKWDRWVVELKSNLKFFYMRKGYYTLISDSKRQHNRSHSLPTMEIHGNSCSTP